LTRGSKSARRRGESVAARVRRSPTFTRTGGKAPATTTKGFRRTSPAHGAVPAVWCRSKPHTARAPGLSPVSSAYALRFLLPSVSLPTSSPPRGWWLGTGKGASLRPRWWRTCRDGSQAAMRQEKSWLGSAHPAPAAMFAPLRDGAMHLCAQPSYTLRAILNSGRLVRVLSACGYGR
jgi:hypothetical protein